jgi:hypothetical protein
MRGYVQACGLRGYGFFGGKRCSPMMKEYFAEFQRS